MQSDLLIYASFLFEAMFWLGAYALILRFAFKEKTFGVPVVAMCGNVAWEYILGLNLFPACPAYWSNCSPLVLNTLTFGAAILDTVIVYTLLRYGRDKFENPLLKQYFVPFVLAGIAFAFVLQYRMMGGLYTPNYYNATVAGAVPDFLIIGVQGGMFTGWALAFMMGILFIRWIYVREGLEGQSIYIAIFMFLGNLGAFFFLLTAARTIPATVQWLIFGGLTVNLIYVGLVYRRSIELGINPWSRYW